MKIATYEQMRKTYHKMGYKFYEGEYNLNIFGIRDPGEKADDMFDCTIGVAYQFRGSNVIERFPATTVPGIFWLKKFFNEKWGGTAIMAEGQYLGAYQIGKQHGSDALIQCRPIRVYRDGNKDLIYDRDPIKIMNGIFSTNIHRAGANSQVIGNWSAGCQVLQRSMDMDKIIELCKKSAAIYGPTFSYTLFADSEISTK